MSLPNLFTITQHLSTAGSLFGCPSGHGSTGCGGWHSLSPVCQELPNCTGSLAWMRKQNSFKHAQVKGPYIHHMYSTVS